MKTYSFQDVFDAASLPYSSSKRRKTTTSADIIEKKSVHMNIAWLEKSRQEMRNRITQNGKIPIQQYLEEKRKHLVSQEEYLERVAEAKKELETIGISIKI